MGGALFEPFAYFIMVLLLYHFIFVVFGDDDVIVLIFSYLYSLDTNLLSDSLLVSFIIL